MTKDHLFKPGFKPWNTGTGGCKKGHDPSLYVELPSGVYVCLGCKRENGKKYRDKNRKEISLRNRVARYKVSLEFVIDLYKSQNERCAICRTPVDFETSRIDHDHITGKVRGILCTSCNTGIGLFKDSPEILINASRYIKNKSG